MDRDLERLVAQIAAKFGNDSPETREAAVIAECAGVDIPRFPAMLHICGLLYRTSRGSRAGENTK